MHSFTFPHNQTLPYAFEIKLPKKKRKSVFFLEGLATLNDHQVETFNHWSQASAH